MHASWRWVFLVNLPVGLLAAGLLHLAYRDPPKRTEGALGSWGPLLVGTCAALLLFALEPGSARVRELCALGSVAVGRTAKSARTLKWVQPFAYRQRGSPCKDAPS